MPLFTKKWSGQVAFIAKMTHFRQNRPFFQNRCGTGWKLKTYQSELASIEKALKKLVGDLVVIINFKWFSFSQKLTGAKDKGEPA